MLIKESDLQKTIFSWHHGLYQFNRISHYQCPRIVPSSHQYYSSVLTIKVRHGIPGWHHRILEEFWRTSWKPLDSPLLASKSRTKDQGEDLFLDARVNQISCTNLQAEIIIRRTENDRMRTTNVATETRDTASILSRTVQRISKILHIIRINHSTI